MSQLNSDYLQLIESSRVSQQTRTVLSARLAPDDPAYEPSALTRVEFSTLRHILARVIPQVEPEIDLAARLDKQLAEAKGDGWRYATLPNDVEAYRAGISLLDDFAIERSAVRFGQLSPAAQHSLLDDVASGHLSSPKFDPRRWFEDLRTTATQFYVSHPQTLARMGYSGIADDPNGFVQIGIGQREEWEPQAQ